MLKLAVVIATGLFAAAMLLNLWRLARGPFVSDRIVALDSLYLNAAGLVVVLGIASASVLWFDAALLITVLGFMGTVALAKYAERGSLTR